MTMVVPPHFDTRRRKELRAELLARARMWIPGWQPGGNGSDVLSSFLEIAARLDAEVIQRLDRVPQKSFRGFLHWLGRRGKSGQVARMPVTFKMSERAESIPASAPVQLQVDAGGTPVIFETEATIRLIVSRLDTIVASEGSDKFYVAFPGLAQLEAPVPAPSKWRILTPARYGAVQVQLDPPEGLAVDMMLADDAGRKYRLSAVKEGLVTLSDPLGSSPETPTLPTGFYSGQFGKVDSFAPFDGQERDRQEHALYIGAKDILDIETAALIRLEGVLPVNCTWSYWGKTGSSESGWQELRPDKISPNLLYKDKAGAIEETEIGKHVSRWLRASPVGGGDVKEQSANRIELAINCTGEPEQTSPKSPIKIEAVANTTPVVLNEEFYPFGREPRQFDAFYLSGPEAFGKPRALVDIEVTLADGFGSPMNAASMVSGPERAFSLVAGVGDDFSLRMVYVISPSTGEPIFAPATRPPSESAQPTRLERQKAGAAHDESADNFARFSVTDGRQVWIWSTTRSLDLLADVPVDNWGTWVPFGRPGVASQSSVVETCLLRSGQTLKIYAVLANGQVHWREIQSDGEWQQLSAGKDQSVPKISRLVPFERESDLPGRATDELGLAGFDDGGHLVYCESAGGAWMVVSDFPVIAADGPIPYPVALWLNEKQRQIFTSAARRGRDGRMETTIESVSLPSDIKTQHVEGVVGNAMSLAWFGSDKPSILYAEAERDGTRPLKQWTPASSQPPVEQPMPPTTLLVAQAPVRLAHGHMLPLARGAVALTGQGDKVAQDETSSAFRSIALPDVQLDPYPTRALLELQSTAFARFSFVDPVKGVGFEMPVFQKRALNMIAGTVHALGDEFEGRVVDGQSLEVEGNVLELDEDEPDDGLTTEGMRLCLRKHSQPSSGPAETLYDVEEVKEMDGKRYAVVKPDIAGATGKRSYFQVLSSDDMTFAFRPTVRIDGHVTENFQLDRLMVEFGGTPYRAGLERLPFEDGDGDRLVLGGAWVGDAPREGTAVRLIERGDASRATTPPPVRSPELSWEYWNGASWWQIPDLRDLTNNLVKSGNVEFCVPADLEPTDVAGRPGRWIRARLVGGDYGQETVRVITTYVKDDADPQSAERSSIQTVERDPSTIRAPLVVGLSVTYELCCAVAPDRIITFDSGGYRDQTDVNLADNARIEVFTPLAKSVRQAGPPELAVPVPGTCACRDGHAEAFRAGSGAAGESDAAEQDGKDKAIYLGFTETLQGDGVSLLVLANEAGETTDPRLMVEAFIDGAFRPLQTKDETRALTESGMITLSIPTPLQRASFFGRSLHWLRLKPETGGEAWAPQIAGVYLNSVWASAGETHRNEVVGRSDGSPGQTFGLVHQDVVDGTLELRIREPLGDDDVEALKLRDPDSVRDDIELWNGPWVRWRKGDLATAATDARIFDLDAALGMVTFGDGVRGAIPPIGTDNIVAVAYRSGANSRGNLVGAWNKPNLISPLRGVEEVVTPQGAAGGNDAQNVEQALIFAPANIAMRDRAITLADFERQSIQSSPDVVQAKAMTTGKGLRVIAVRRGPNPMPTAAMRRALERYLKQRSSAAFSRPQALSVEGPAVVRIGLSGTVTVQDLALAGAIAEEARRKVMALFDTTTGGIDQRGWPLGLMVAEADLAAVISDVAGILEIDSLSMRRIDNSTAAVRDNELVILSESDLSITCRQATEEAA